jgi:hypothetical protein
LDPLADICGQDIRGGGVFTVGQKTIRVYVPKKGQFVDFTSRNFSALHSMHQHGENIARKILNM